MKWPEWRILIVSVSVLAILVWIAHVILHVDYWTAFGICFTAILVNAIVAKIEGRRPGAFENPRPPKDPSEDE